MRLLFFAPFLLFLGSCTDKVLEPNSDYDFSPFIQGHTSGLISSRSPIEVFFTNPVPNYSELVPGKYISIEPEVAGTWVFEDSQLLKFVPKTSFPQGEKIQVSLSLNELLKGASDVPVFSFDFQVVEQTLRLGTFTMMALGQNQNVWNRVELDFFSADFLDESSATQRISITQGGQNCKLKWEMGSDGLTHRVVIDSVHRGEAADSLLVQWKMDDNSGKESFVIPSIYEFMVVSAKAETEPVQRFIINFSDPLLPDQNVLGLVQVNDQTDGRMVISSNSLEIYPASALMGNVTLSIEGGLKNISGGRLENRWTWVHEFRDMLPEAHFLKGGDIVPSSGKMVIPIEYMNLNALDVRVVKVFHNNLGAYFQNESREYGQSLKYVGRPVLEKTVQLPNARKNKWATISIDLTEIVGSDPSALYNVQLSYKPSYSTYKCPTPLEDPSYNSENWDSKGYDYVSNWNIEGFNWDEKDNPCHVSYFNYDRFPTRTFLFSNLGLVVRDLNQGKYLAVVTNLLKGLPEADAEVVFYSLQNQVLGKVKTNGEGIVEWKSNAIPFRAEAVKGNYRAFLTLDRGRALSMANFETDGVSGELGLKAFLYGERGVWRPGDTVFANMIVQDLDGTLSKGAPIIFEWKDPDGNTLKKWVRSYQSNPILTEKITTSSSQRTGNYTLSAKVGEAVFQKRFPLEFIKPNKLKATLRFEATRIANQEEVLDIEAKWLTGLPASKLKVTIDAKAIKEGDAFPEAKGYIFSNPLNTVKSEAQEILNTNLDEQGKARQKIKTAGFDASGPVLVDYVTRVFEPGGDFSIQVDRQIVLSHATLVGFKEPTPANPEYGWLESGKSYPIPILLKNANGSSATGKVKVELFKVSWSWWWSSDDQRSAQYQNKLFQEKVTEDIIQVNQGRGQWNVKVNSNEYGRYFVRFTDLKSGHTSGTFLYFDWGSDRIRTDRESQEGPAFLAMRSKEPSYSVGGNAEVYVPSTGTGKILVFLDKGTGPVGHFWTDSKPGVTKLSIPIKPEMAPTLYVYAVEIQAHANTENNLPMRMYGVIPIEVFEEKTKLTPKIKAPEKIAPNSNYNITVTEVNGKPMNYTLAVVDEGLLSITQFKTPAPWLHFYGKEAYTLRTWDMYDQVMGAFGGRIDQHLALGGDENLRGGGADNGLRFKPVVSFIGPFALGKGQSKTHALHMPNYAGAVRVMVVAAGKDAFGHAEAEVPVTKPLMALISAPRQIGVGEEVEIPINLFVLEDKLGGNIQVTLDAGGIQTQSIKINGKGSYNALFRIKAPVKSGKLNLKASASSNGISASDNLALEVIHQAPLAFQFDSKWIEPGKTQVLSGSKLQGLEWWRVGLSSLGGFSPQGLSDFLAVYPYGCSEQIMSRTIIAGLAAGLHTFESQEIEKYFSIGNQKLSARQTGNGGFLLWDQGTEADPWATSMFGLHVMAGKAKGIQFPESRVKVWVSFQTKKARSWTSGSGTASIAQVDQAFRLFSLAMVGQPDMGGMNRLHSEKDLSRTASLLLAACYAKTGQKEMGLSLLRRPSEGTGGYGRFMNPNCHALIEAYCLSQLNKENQAFEVLQTMFPQGIDMNKVTTQEAMWALLTLQQLMGNATFADLSATWKANGKELPVGKGKTWSQPQVKGSKLVFEVTNHGTTPFFMQVVSAKRPQLGAEIERKEGVSLSSRWLKKNGEEIGASIPQGAQFNLEVKVMPLQSGSLRDLALEIPIPSGFEVSNPNLFDGNGPSSGIQQMEIRDDKILVFFDAKGGQAMTFNIELTSTFAGRYYAGPIQITSMYRPAIGALIQGKWIEVYAGQP